MSLTFSKETFSARSVLKEEGGLLALSHGQCDQIWQNRYSLSIFPEFTYLVSVKTVDLLAKF